MNKPESNAPAPMQQWVRTTDKQIADLEATVAKLQSMVNGAASVDFEQNKAINSTFTFAPEGDGNNVVYSSGINFNGDIVSDSNISVAGAVVVGNPTRQEYDPETGEAINAIPNFEMNAGTAGTNPVTGELEYYPGRLHMNDTELNLDVSGKFVGDGLSLVLSNSAQAARENVEIISASGDGTTATYSIIKNESTLASYVAGQYVNITGVNPSGYNTDSSLMLTVDTSGTDLVFTIENETTDTYVAGGYSTIASANSTYEGALSVRGPGPNYYGATVNQDGLFIGVDGGNPAVSATSITPGVISAPEVAASYLNVDGTRVFVSSTQPAGPVDGDIWIDPNGAPLGGVTAPHAATHGVSGSDPVTLAQSQIVNLTTDLAAKAALNNPTFTRVASDEGGQINFQSGNTSGNTWWIDSYGSTTTPTLRVGEATSVRVSVAPGGDTTFTGKVIAPGVPYSMSAGSISITPVANTPTSAAVTFPVGRFTQAPLATTNANTTVIGSTVQGTAVSSVTTSGMNVWVYRSNTTSTIIYWQAVQMTSSASAG